MATEEEEGVDTRTPLERGEMIPLGYPLAWMRWTALATTLKFARGGTYVYPGLPLQAAQGGGIGVFDGGADELFEQPHRVVHSDLRDVAGGAGHGAQ